MAWLCYLVLAGLRGSRGKVLHNDLLLLWASVPFLLAPVSVTWHDRERRREHGWPVRSAMVIAALVYFLAGYHKVRRSGLGLGLRRQRPLRDAVGSQRRAPRSGTPWPRGWPSTLWASKATGALILTFELTFPVALVRRRLQPVYAVVAVALHVTTYLFLGLDYWAWAVTVLLLFVDWPRVIDRVRGRRLAASVGCAPVTASTDPHTGSFR